MADYELVLRETLRRFLSESEVRVREPASVLPEVLRRGRVLNQFETYTSGGVLNPTRRLLIEQALMGVPPETMARYRPTYGYLAGSDESYSLPQYGDVVLRLRRELCHRTTFTFGDSFDHTYKSTHPYFVPSLMARPSLLSLDCSRDLLACGEPWEATDPDYRYIEAQVHGELTLSDVHEIVFTRQLAPDPSTIDLMTSRGMPWRTVEGDDPDGA